MSEIKTLLKQSTYYFAGQLIIMVAGFISFPILTRIFSVSDYGILGLITTTVLIVTALSKLGLPNSIVRFYAEFKSKEQLASLYTTIILGSAGFAAGIAIVFGFVITYAATTFLAKDVINLLPFVSILIFTGSTLDTLNSFFRAEEKAVYYSLVSVIRRYASLAAGIFFVFYISKGLLGFVLGQTVSGVIIFLSVVYVVFKKERISVENFSPEIFKGSLKFGFPLIWSELGHLFLHYTDRYLIQLFLGSVSLGLYTAGYNLATYVTEMIIYPINYAMLPIYMRILVSKGEEKTKEFFTKSFRYFLLVIFGIVLGFIAVGKDLISLLATTKYLEAYSVLPYIVVGQSIYACSIILNNGLFIRKKTYIVTNVMLVTCLLNTGINVILIPRLGIIGAGWANLVSNIFYTSVITYYAFKEFSFRIDYGHILLYFASSLIMFIAVRNIHLESQFLNLISRIVIGVVVYFTFVLLFDRELRSKFRNFVRNPKESLVGI